jgi:hypothetical protein
MDPMNVLGVILFAVSRSPIMAHLFDICDSLSSILITAIKASLGMGHHWLAGARKE